MKKRKLIIILLLLDIIAITLIVCNAKFDIFNKAIAKISAIFHPVQEYNITPHDKPKPTPVNPVNPDTPDTPDEPVVTIRYPLEVSFDTMGGTTVDEVSFFLDGSEKTIDDLVYPECDYLEYEFVEWEKKESTKKIDGEVIYIWEFFATWEYSPLTYYTKLLSVSNFSLEGDKYCREIEKDVTSCEILSDFKYRNNVATAKLYSNSACTDEVTDVDVTINPGVNSFWVKIDAGIYGFKVWEVEVYRVIEYSVSFTVNGVMDSIDGLDGFVVKQKDYATLERIAPLLQKDGYTFEPSVNLSTIIDQNLDVVITVSYTKYSINYLNTKGVSNTNATEYDMSEEVVLSPLVNNGYEFDGWFIDDTPVTKIEIGSIGDKSISAKWTTIVYSIAYELNGGNAENVESYTVEDNVKINSPLKKGYIFDFWSIFDEDDNPLVYDENFVYSQNVKLVASYHEALTSSYYGKYPQEVVTDAELISRLNSVSPISGVYKLDGNEYIKEIANGFIDGLKFRDGTDVINGKEYYFKLSPIEWIEIYADDNEHTLITKYVLNVGIFDGNSNNYSIAQIKTLVENMKNEMLTSEELFNLVKVEINNSYETVNQDPELFIDTENWQYGNVEGYAYIPSYKEVNTILAEASTLVTDYAIANGCLFNPMNYKAFYFYRSPYSESREHYVAGYNASGEGTSDGCLDINTAYGLRVIVCVESGDKTE